MSRTLHTRVAWLDRPTIDGRRIINPQPANYNVPVIWHGTPTALDPWDGLGNVGYATVHRQRLAGEQWHSLGATIHFHPEAFRPEFMDAIWTVDLGHMRMDFLDGLVVLDGPRVTALSGGPGIRWAWDDGTLPDPILWEGAD